MRHIKNLLGPKTLLSLSLLYTLLLTFVSLSENSDLPEPRWWEYQDKVAHVLAYCILGGLWGLFYLFRRKTGFWKPYFFAIVATALVYGTIIEILQHTITESRMADLWDILANTLGTILGVIVAWYSYHKWLSIKK